MEFYEACYSCNLLIVMKTALLGFDEQVYGSLANAVTTTGAAIATITLLVTIIMRTQIGLDGSASPQVANEVFGTLARLAWCTGVLASFPFWKLGVIGVIDSGIASIVNITLNALPASAPTYSGNPEPGLDYALTALNATEITIFGPLAAILDAVQLKFSLSAIGNAVLIYIGITVMMFLGILDLAFLLLFYGEFMFWRFLITAFGPIIVFAWVFPATRPAAWSALKLLIQAGLTIIMSTGVVGIIVAAFAAIAPDLPVKNNDIKVEHLNSFFSMKAAGQAMLIQVFALALFAFVKLVSLLIVFGSAANQASKNVMSVATRFMGR